MTEYESKEVVGKAELAQFLEYMTPALLLDKFKSTGSMFHRLEAENIASGRQTTKREYQEYTYAGDWSAPDVAKWLGAFDSSWSVELNYGDELSVLRWYDRPVTQEEIEQAKAQVAKYDTAVTEYVKFSTPPNLLAEDGKWHE